MRRENLFRSPQKREHTAACGRPKLEAVLYLPHFLNSHGRFGPDGKWAEIAISDEILQKPAPLAEKEWEELRKHPLYAYEVLYPIAYLKPALDIPFCHHQRWDGSGYPQGLKGEEIPLMARLFAIVDVWDALSHDRPYRKANPPREVIKYLQQAGRLFDPHLVRLFISIAQEENRSRWARVSGDPVSGSWRRGERFKAPQDLLRGNGSK